MPPRIRRRYLALKIDAEQTFSERDVESAIWNAFLQLFGEYGASQAETTLIEYNPQRSYAIVRCSHQAVEMMKASTAAITEINQKAAAVHVLRVSGTLKALRKSFSR